MASIWQTGRLARRAPGVGGILLLALLVAAILTAGDERDRDAGAPRRVEARVLRVIDGDTIEVSVGGAEEDVRYIGVDAPESVAPGEPVECFGRRAARFNERLVGGRAVELVFDRERCDRYGRLLAYVRAGDRFANDVLVRRGFARTLEIEPNTARAPRLSRLEVAAGRRGRGLWGECR